MANQTKQYEVENIAALLSDAKSVAMVDYQGIPAEEVRKLRQKLNQAGGDMLVTKNTLIRIALRKLGIELESPLEGPTALIFANQDAISPLKALDEVREQLEKPTLKIGVFEKKIISSEKLEELISLPGKKQLLANFTAGLANPLQRLARSLAFNQTKLVLALKAVAEQNQE